MFVKRNVKKSRGKVYTSTLLVEGYRDKNNKVRHNVISNLSRMPPAMVAQIEVFLKGCPSVRPQYLPSKSSKEYGNLAAVVSVLEDLGLDKLIYSRNTPWRKLVILMIAARIIEQGSKLAIIPWLKDVAADTALGIDSRETDVDDLYEALDRLLKRQPDMQKKLAAQSLGDGSLVFYDLTSTYFEGTHCAIARFGYNRDGKRGVLQVNIGLIADDEGRPVGVEVFEGNVKDSTTVESKINELKHTWGLQEVIFVGDRGMSTIGNIEKLHAAGFRYISALTHKAMLKKIEDENHPIQLGLFDTKKIAEIIDPEKPRIRYCLCKNDESARRETATRAALMEKTGKKLSALEQSVANGNIKKRDKILAAAVKAVHSFRMGRFYSYEAQKGAFRWRVKTDALERERQLDGCYVIVSDVSPVRLDKDELVDNYKRLGQVESAFRQIKTMRLEIRPVYHWRPDRVKSHIFLCMLSYLVQFEMLKRLQPLFEKNGEGKNRHWTFEAVLKRLSSLREEERELEGHIIHTYTCPDDEQAEILRLLGVEYPSACCDDLET